MKSWRSTYRPNMKNNNLIRFVQSLVLLPVMTTLSIGGAANLNTTKVPQNALVQKVNMEAKGTFALNQAADPEAELKEKTEEAQAQAIDAYFAERKMPLLGTGKKMVEVALLNDLDWRLLPAIAVRESTGGKFKCQKVPNNPFGWGSCKIGFKTMDAAIETVGKNLGGNNPKTAHYYDNKTTKEILNAYNPPSIVRHYTPQVIAIMDVIGAEDFVIDMGKDLARVTTI